MEQMLSSNPEEILLPSTHTHSKQSDACPRPENPLSNKKEVLFVETQIAARLNQHSIDHI
jgi:hypothetical protein